MAYDYTNLETAIYDKLSADINSADAVVRYIPESDGDGDIHPLKPTITISYQQSIYSNESITTGQPEMYSTAEMVQPDLAEVHIIISSPSRRINTKTKGIFWLNSKVQESLVGFKPDIFDRMYVKSFSFLERQENVHYFALVMGCTRLIVQRYTDDHGTTYDNLTDTDFNLNPS